MSNKKTSPPNNLMGPVARERYAQILKDAAQKRITTLEDQIEQHKPAALQTWLEQQGLAEDVTTWNTLSQKFQEKIESSRRYYDSESGEVKFHPLTPRSLMPFSKVNDGVTQMLHDRAELKPLFAEIERLEKFKDSIEQKVWLAQCPQEISDLLQQIGQ